MNNYHATTPILVDDHSVPVDVKIAGLVRWLSDQGHRPLFSCQGGRGDYDPDGSFPLDRTAGLASGYLIAGTVPERVLEEGEGDLPGGVWFCLDERGRTDLRWPDEITPDMVLEIMNLFEPRRGDRPG